MNRHSPHTAAWSLVALLFVGIAAVPLGHAAAHLRAGTQDAWHAPTVQADCGLCHQTYVAVTPDVPASHSATPLGQVAEPSWHTPPVVFAPAPQPRGPPVLS